MEDLFSTSLIASYVDDRRFVGRRWLVEQVREALAKEGAQFLLVTGEPGSGKSSLMAHLARTTPTALRHFIRRDSVTSLQGGDARSLLFALGHQLAHVHPRLFDAERIHAVVRQRAEADAHGVQMVGIEIENLYASPFYTTALEVYQSTGADDSELVGMSIRRAVLEPRLLELSNLQYLALLDPARVLYEDSPSSLLLVLVDALDEIRYGPRGESILTWLATCPPLPPNLRFVLTSRPDPQLLHNFREAKASSTVELTIDTSDNRVHIRRDLHRFLRHFAREAPVAAAFRRHDVAASSFIESSLDLAEGNFQYLVAITRAIDHELSGTSASPDLAAILTLSGIPSDMKDLYRFFLSKVREAAEKGPVKVSTSVLAEPEDRPAWQTLHFPVLAVLAMAFEPLSVSQIHQYSGAPLTAMPRVLEDLGQFLDRSPNGHYRLYHATMSEYLTDEGAPDPADPYHVDAASWHALVAGRLLRANTHWELPVDHYALGHTVDHFAAAIRMAAAQDAIGELAEALIAMLNEFRYLEQKTRILGVDSLFSDFVAALQVVPSAGLDDLIRILHREAHNLRRPEVRTYPAFFAQQVRNAAALDHSPLIVAAAERRLRELDRPHLRLRWSSSGVASGHLRTLTGHSSSVLSLAVDRASGRGVSGCLDGTIALWDLRAGRMERMFVGHEGPVWAVAVASRFVVSAGEDGAIRVWDTDCEHELKTLTGHVGPVYALSATADARIASGGADGTVRLWDLSSPRRSTVVSAHGGAVRAVTLFEDGRIFSAGDDGVIRAGNMRSATPLTTHLTDNRGAIHALTGAEELLGAAGDDGTIRVWDLRSFTLRTTLPGHGGAVRGLAMSERGQMLSAGLDNVVRVWDIDPPRLVASLVGHDSGAVAVGDVGSNSVVSASYDRTIRIWNPDKAGDVGEGHFGWVSAMAIAEDVAVSGSYDGTLKVWSVASGKIARSVSGGQGPIHAVRIARNGSAISAGDDGTICEWDLRSGRRKKVFVGHDGPVWDVALSGDGWMISGGGDGTVRHWDLTAGGLRRTVSAHQGAVRGVGLNAAGQVATGGDDGMIRIWDLASWRLQKALSGHSGPIRAINVMDNGLVLAAGDDGVVRVWDISNGMVRHELLGHELPVWSVTVAMGDGYVSGSDDRTVRLWNEPTERQLALVALQSVPTTLASRLGSGVLMVGDAGSGVQRFDLVLPDLVHGGELG